MVPGLDAELGQAVGELVGAGVERPVRQVRVAAGQRLAVGHVVDDALEEVGKVELHRRG